jgi:hypothetical protein
MNDQVMRIYACAVAAHVLPIFTRRFPTDRTIADAIGVAARYAMGRAGRRDLDRERGRGERLEHREYSSGRDATGHVAALAEIAARAIPAGDLLETTARMAVFVDANHDVAAFNAERAWQERTLSTLGAHAFLASLRRPELADLFCAALDGECPPGTIGDWLEEHGLPRDNPLIAIAEAIQRP